MYSHPRGRQSKSKKPAAKNKKAFCLLLLCVEKGGKKKQKASRQKQKGFLSFLFNSAKRTRDVAQARQVAMYLAKQHTKAPLTVIGSSIGGRNHATVLHSCKAVADMMDTDKQFKLQIEEIERIVLGKK